MKNKFMLFSLAFFIGFNAQAQESSNAIFATSTIQFDETEFHFGTVNAGDKVQHVFRFTNTGDEPLLLTNARGSCGCTVPSWPKDPIETGESGAIVVEFDSKGKSGAQVKQVTITANTDPVQSILYIKGEVKSNLDIDEPVVEQPVVKWPIKEAAYEANVYPNPASNDFFLKIKDADGLAASVEIFNKNGQRMSKREVGAWEGQLQLDATDLAVGNYWISVKMGDAERFSVPFSVNR
ncbi:MAG: DUF1573 domain-containing protein [Bacteroidetes bacterium]|nr:DUF1573 domain-containing protein [Bacteroidota bacterium]